MEECDFTSIPWNLPFFEPLDNEILELEPTEVVRDDDTVLEIRVALVGQCRA